MDQLIDEWPIVSVNRIHLGLMSAALLKLAEGACHGELRRMDWFTIDSAGLDVDVKLGSIDYSNRILLFYSVWAIADLVMYYGHHPFALWALNCLHHVFRIFLLASAVSGSAVCIWEAICQVTYCMSCACLYMKIGLVVDDRTSSRLFRRLARYSFFASIVTRLMGYVFAFWFNFLETYRLYPIQTLLLFSVYFLFDAAYLTFHCLPPPPKKPGDNNGRKKTDSASSDDQGSQKKKQVASGVLCDVFDREMFYPFGEGMVAPMRRIGLTPNMVTILSGLLQVAGLYLLLVAQSKLFVMACVFLGYTLDCVEGQMARRYGLVSDFGAALDTGKDAAVTLGYFIVLYMNCGLASLLPLLLVAFATVARGGMVSKALPFQVCFRLVNLLPRPLQTVALSCHGGVFTVCMLLAILFGC